MTGTDEEFKYLEPVTVLEAQVEEKVEYVVQERSMLCGGWSAGPSCTPAEDPEAVALAEEFRPQALAALAGRGGEGAGGGGVGWTVVRVSRASQVVAGTNLRVRIAVDLSAATDSGTPSSVYELVLQKFVPLPCNVAEGDVMPGWRMVSFELDTSGTSL